MIYFAILPQFMHESGSVALQAAVLSAIFMGLCGLVYVGLSVFIACVGHHEGFGVRQRRWIEAAAGALLLVATVRLAGI